MTARRFALAPLFLLAGCGGGDPAANEAAGNAAPLAVATDAPVNAALGNEAAPAEGELSVYVGKYPEDEVDGVAFLDNARVKAAVAAVVTDATARDFVLNSDGPANPIVAKGGRIIAWGCEAHNCGFHNWAVAITPNGSAAEVCLFNDPGNAKAPPATWYVAGGKTEQRAGSCPSE